MVYAPEGCGCAYAETGASISNSPICNGVLLFMTILEQFINGRCAISDPCRRITGSKEVKEEYDFVVVGGGSAGSLVAGRLAENPNFNVLLIEAGGIDPVGSRVPSFYRDFWNNAEADWMYRTVPGDYCLDEGAKGCTWIRGKSIGGSSIQNGMMYHRGHAADFDDWVAAGASKWTWEENQPFYLKSEDNKQIGLYNASYHGTGGPMPISQFRYQPEFVYEILKAVNESGFPVIHDLVDPNTPYGFAIAQMFSDDGQRFTTARAFIENHYNTSNNNLHVILESHVSKVIFNGSRAIGVEYIQNGNTKSVYASKEVILSAGALGTPKILILSGIGPSNVLNELNIPPVVNLPVGRNLRNHIGTNLYFIMEKEFNSQVLDWSVSSEYLLERTGPMTSTGITQLTGTLYSSYANRSAEQPDTQFFFNGYYAECSSTGVIGEPVGDCPQNGRNISVSAVALRPKSVGYLTLKSRDPMAAPLFYANYFTHPQDMAVVKEAALYVKTIIESETMQKYGIKWDDSYNACSASGSLWSETWLECIIRNYTDPQNHQIGTASIMSVVDQDLKVYNVDGLRVIDASIIPTAPTGNPQGVIMMVAERGVDFIRTEWS